MKKLKIMILIDIVVTLISIILMIVENKSSHYGLSALESVGRFVIYMGVTFIALIVLVVLVIILLIKAIKKK